MRPYPSAMASDRVLILLLLSGLLSALSACKSDKAFDLTPAPVETGQFHARGILISVDNTADTLTFDYRSGEASPWGETVIADVFTDSVNFPPQTGLFGQLTLEPGSPVIFATGFFTDRNQADLEPQGIPAVLTPGDTLAIGVLDGQALISLTHPGFQASGSAWSLPEENESGINAKGAGYVVLRTVEPFAVTAHDLTRTGYSVDLAFAARLNGPANSPDWWAEGEARIFVEAGE